MNEICKGCGEKIILPGGSPNSKILIVGEFPTFEEIKAGRPFMSKAGDVLRAELNRAGLSMDLCRTTTLWKHYKDEETCDVTHHCDTMFDEFRDKEAILLLGSELSKFLFQKKITDISGLECSCDAFPPTLLVAITSIGPGTVLAGTVGEFRYAINKFVSLYKERKNGR